MGLLQQLESFSTQAIVNGIYEVIGYDIVGTPDPEEVLELLNHVKEMCQPLERRTTIMLLSKLHLMTKQKSQDQADIKLQIAAYAEQLDGFPGDAVQEALEKWPVRSKWWPSFRELYEEIHYLAKARIHLKEKLERQLIYGVE